MYTKVDEHVWVGMHLNCLHYLVCVLSYQKLLLYPFLCTSFSQKQRKQTHTLHVRKIKQLKTYCKKSKSILLFSQLPKTFVAAIPLYFLFISQKQTKHNTYVRRAKNKKTRNLLQKKQKFAIAKAKVELHILQQ